MWSEGLSRLKQTASTDTCKLYREMSSQKNGGGISQHEKGLRTEKNHECSQTQRAVITEKLMTVNSKHASTCSRYCSICGFADLFWLLDYQWRDRSFCFFFTRPLVFSYPQPHIHTFSGKYADTVYCPRSLVQVLPDSSTKYERYEKKTLLSRPRLREIKYMYTTFEKDLEIILQKKK